MRVLRDRLRLRSILAIAFSCLACGVAEAPDTSDATPAGSGVSRIDAPPRVHDDGSPDACELLGAADPAGLLGSEIGPAMRIYGLCRVEDAARPEPERSVGLEIRRDRAAGVPSDLDGFWEREGGGVGMLGSGRDRIEELDGLGDYALWFPIPNGLQLFAYWGGEYILVATVRGAPPMRALPWAQELAQASIRAASPERETAASQ